MTASLISSQLQILPASLIKLIESFIPLLEAPIDTEKNKKHILPALGIFLVKNEPIHKRGWETQREQPRKNKEVMRNTLLLWVADKMEPL